MKYAFLFVNWYSIGLLSAAVASDSWRQGPDAALYIRSYGKLLPRVPSGLGSPKPSKSPKPPSLTIPGNKPQEGDKRYTSPRPSRDLRIDPARGLSPYSNERSASLESIARGGIAQLGRGIAHGRNKPVSDKPSSGSLDTGIGDGNRQDGTPEPAKDDRSVDRRKAKDQSSVEAHSLVSGTGYVFSSSKHKYGGLSSHASVEDVQLPVMRSARDRGWVKAGGVTRSPESKATAVAAGYKVTGKLGLAEKNEGRGFIEFRAGNAFQQTHHVGPGEKIERMLSAGDVLDSKNDKVKQVTVTTHFTGEGSCLAGACSHGQPDMAPQKETGKDKQA
ncbi:MAG: hypothetical protein GOMPHAMPRED_006685 [Gomphillus americanus]|uniref:Uncharacterized protein n=1 Tax=Gomphillus americanus TaxID=1940652 RepID=A0A8H3IYK8_9LECA|nr:MAG: hypothetical protein GOMPHAMPRED_006685 [Gomphillus americanus]